MLKFLVKSKIVPAGLRNAACLDTRQPIIYILPYNSKIDLLTLRMQCLQQDLPDPIKPLQINNFSMPRCIFTYENTRLLSRYPKKSTSVSLVNRYLDLYRLNSDLDIQIILIFIIFGRSPGREIKNHSLVFQLKLVKIIKKIFTVIWFGRDSFIHFSRPLSMRDLITKHGTHKSISQNLIRLARIYFTRQHLVMIGPRLPVRKDLFKKILEYKIIKKSIQNEARSKKLSVKKAQQNAIKLLEEIAANFSYEAIRLFDRLLGCTWNWCYQGIYVRNAERVRTLAEKGHKIVYLPCHRSHMDYLLLSYVIYHQGLVPPHIAAGINLNFWPAGTIFRRLGAFFIRRTFKANKLYSNIFREYLGELFNRGYSVEYFIEGGRSRTGRLLEPKTGILTMTIQTMLRGGNLPITLVPIYIGYEHVIEVANYANELRSTTKKYSFFYQKIPSLRKLGKGYVTFGDPIHLDTWLSQEVPHWRDSINSIEIQRPKWLSLVVDKIATTIMVRINNAAVVNAINICSSILLVSCQYSLTRTQLLSQLTCYLDLLRNVPYAYDVTVPNMMPEELFEHALAMNKFSIQNNTVSDIIFLSREQIILMNYYRNNIQHLLVLPSLVANIIYYNHGIALEQLKQRILILYPLFKAELFMCYSKQQLLTVIDDLITELSRQGLLKKQVSSLYPVPLKLFSLQLLAACVNEILQRYNIIFSLLRIYPQINRDTLGKKSRIIAQQLSVLYGINAPDFFDKTIFSTIISTLRSEGYINDNSNNINEKLSKMCSILSELITPEVLKTIQYASIMMINKPNITTLPTAQSAD